MTLIRESISPRTLKSPINGTTQTFAPAITGEQQAILDALRTPKLTH